MICFGLCFGKIIKYSDLIPDLRTLDLIQRVVVCVRLFIQEGLVGCIPR